MKSWMRRITLGMACLGPLFVARIASAQLVLASDPVERPNRTSANNPYNLTDEQVNYTDCFANQVIRFHLASADFNLGDLEVWEGPSCQTDAQRNGDNATCRQVFGGSNELSFNIRIQDLIETQEGHTPGTQDACDFPVADNDKLDLHFMLINGTTALEGFTPPVITIEYRLLGPPPPTNVEMSIGEEALILTWDENENTQNIRGYNLYCIPGCMADVGAGAGGAPADDGAAGADGSGLEGATSSAIPPLQYKCGETSSLTDSGQTDNLMNGQTYTVGVAARDSFGNAGGLSETVCGTPEPVVGFYEAYRAAGGKGGGGGICSLSGPARSGLGALGAGALFLVAAAFRRLRSRRT